MATSLTLYELTAQQQRIEDMLIENGGEITEELAALMDENAEALTEKVDGYNKILRKFEGAEAALDAEIKRLTALKKTAQNSQKSLKEHLLYAMQSAGLDKLEGNLCKASVRHSTALEVDEDVLMQPYNHKIFELANALPAYITLTAKVSKTDLKAAYPKDCEAMPAGCTYVENTSVTIR